MKHAVVIGKFHPLHKGHSYLIDTALNECEEVTVLVCDNQRYTIPAKTRADWVRALHPSATIKIIPDIGKDDDSEAWARHTVEFLGSTPDVVYTSESYGDTWSKAMGCEHRKVDPNRKKVPISATKIREDIKENWNSLHPVVKKDLVYRVVVVGAESTGTTTLASKLSEHYKAPWTVELGRYYSQSLMYTDHEWTDEDFVSIATMQQAYENNMASLSNGLLICDTNAFATKLWQERYMGHTTLDAENYAHAAPADLYILTEDDIPFVQDGLRDGEYIRHTMHERFIEELQKLGTPFIIVRGGVEKRLNESIKVIDEARKKKLQLYKDAKNE